MLERPRRLQFDLTPRSYYTYAVDQSHKGKPSLYFTYAFLFLALPYVSVRTYHFFEQHLKGGYWERRIEEKRVRKMAFDYMLKGQADKDRDLIEEFADF